MHSRFKHAIPSVDGGVIRTTLLLPFLPSPYCVKGPWKPNRTVIALYIDTHCISTRTVYQHALYIDTFIIYIAIPHKVRVDILLACQYAVASVCSHVLRVTRTYHQCHRGTDGSIINMGITIMPLWRPYVPL